MKLGIINVDSGEKRTKDPRAYQHQETGKGCRNKKRRMRKCDVGVGRELSVPNAKIRTCIRKEGMNIV